MGRFLYSYISQIPFNFQRNGPCSALSCAINAQMNNVKQEWRSSKAKKCNRHKIKNITCGCNAFWSIEAAVGGEFCISALLCDKPLSTSSHILYVLSQTQTSRQTSIVQTSFLLFVVGILGELSGGDDTPSTQPLPVQVKWLRQGQRALAELNHEHYFLKISVQH